MIYKISLVSILMLVVTIGFTLQNAKKASAEINPEDAETLKKLVQEVVSHDIGDFVEQFYPEDSRLFVFLNDPNWDIERLKSGVYLISVHIESYQKHGEFPLGRDILTIKIDPKELNQFFSNPDPKKIKGHGIHIVQCEHQIPKVDHHKVTFSPPREVKGAFCR